MTVTTMNPATGKVLKTYPEMSSQEVTQIVQQAHAAHVAWKKRPMTERTAQLTHLKNQLAQQHEQFAQIITQEMGKPITAARAEVDKCLLLCDYYIEHASQQLAPRNSVVGKQTAYVCYEPIGVVLAIMPWNFPLWQAMRFLVPNLMTGNAGLLSHAPISTGCALLLEQLVQAAGYPKDIFRAVIVNHDVAAEIINNPLVRGVTLTGSERAGRAVASEAGRALKKVVLELGGSDPYVILADADLELAATTCVQSRLNNSGQVCVAAKRLITVPDVTEQFQKLVIAKAKEYHMGDPQDANCKFGPMAREDLRKTLHEQVQQCIAQGAELICGGEIPQGPGFYYPVTILSGIKPGMPAYDDEMFGPVIALLEAKDEADAIRMANDVRFGLGAAVFTRDIARGEQIAREQLQAGTCCVNAMVASHPALPFGGTKFSGFGRELSVEGIHEFVNIKTVCVAEE